MAVSLTETKKKRTRKRGLTLIAASLIVSLAGVALILFSTTPDRLGPVGITAFFVLVFIALLTLGALIRHVLSKNAGPSSLLFIILSSAAITISLAIGTIELQIGDVILLGLFVITFSIYWSRLR